MLGKIEWNSCPQSRTQCTSSMHKIIYPSLRTIADSLQVIDWWMTRNILDIWNFFSESNVFWNSIKLWVHQFSISWLMMAFKWIHLYAYLILWHRICEILEHKLLLSLFIAFIKRKQIEFVNILCHTK